ncbi:MAG TPA: sugar ABC transporter permease [Dongiaceae bacterium]|nr:sugar ABC transporter permease [Dongiaceae bacterium]
MTALSLSPAAPFWEAWVERNLKYIFLAPAVLILLGLTAFPTLYMYAVAFQKYDPADPTNSQWVGLDNFVRLLSDDKFHNSLWRTLEFTVSAVSVEFLLGLSFALLVDRYVRRLNFVKTILMLPMMLPPISVAIVWKLMYQPDFGIINSFLRALGLPALQWASGFGTAMLSIVLVDIWEWTPFIFLMCLAGLASMPVEPFEAAEIDGANAWQKFRDLTWPFLRPVIAITLLLRIMDAFRLFDQVFILTLGGPAAATETLSFYIYKVAFRFFDLGYAAAISIFMLVVTMTFSSWLLRRMKLAE